MGRGNGRTTHSVFALLIFSLISVTLIAICVSMHVTLTGERGGLALASQKRKLWQKIFVNAPLLERNILHVLCVVHAELPMHVEKKDNKYEDFLKRRAKKKSLEVNDLACTVKYINLCLALG